LRGVERRSGRQRGALHRHFENKLSVDVGVFSTFAHERRFLGSRFT